MEQLITESIIRRVALYSRVSTEDQAREGYSLGHQREFLETYAERQGWEVVHPEPGRIYEDDGFSGGTLLRPALQRLMRDAKAKRFDLVLVYKLDRFSRKLKDVLNLIDDLESLGSGFKSATEPFDTTTSGGKLMLQQLGSFAEFERARIAERVFPGMVRSVRQGNWHGARWAPYGYRYNKEKQLLEVHAEEVKIVELIFATYLSGRSTLRITHELYKIGIRNRLGGFVTNHFVCGVLRNPVYIGKIIWNKRHYDPRLKTQKGYLRSIPNPPENWVEAKGKHQPIISEQKFDLAQKRLASNRKGVLHRANVREYLLSGILFCPRCNHKYLGGSFTSNHRTKQRKRWYRCMAGVQHGIRCDNPSVQSDLLESQVLTVLEMLLSHPAAKEGRIDQLVNRHARVKDEHLDQQRKELKGALKGNLDRQSKLTTAYLDGTIAPEVYKERCSGLREEELRLKGSVAKLDMQVIERERSKEYQKLLQRAVDEFDPEEKKIDLIKKRELLRLLFKRILVDNGKIASFELYQPFQKMYNEALAGIDKGRQAKELTQAWQGTCILAPTDAR